MLDEKALRRPGFSEGFSVELGDSQKWTLPAVRIRMYPIEMEDGTIKAAYRPVYADQLEDELDVLFGIKEGSFADLWDARFRIAYKLLKSNYDLSARDAGMLLSYVPGDEASEARWEKIRAATLGRNPDEDDEGEEAPKGDTPNGSD